MKLKENKEGCMAGFEGRTEKGKYYNYILISKRKKGSKCQRKQD